MNRLFPDLPRVARPGVGYANEEGPWPQPRPTPSSRALPRGLAGAGSSAGRSPPPGGPRRCRGPTPPPGGRRGGEAPLTVLRLAELAGQVLPPGVLNAVPGLAAGPALAAHPRVERITFTGATATGRRVLQTAAENLTYATMELGGKNAVLVLADADLDAAVHVAVEGMFYNQGEACTSTARILVHESVHDDFLA